MTAGLVIVKRMDWREWQAPRDRAPARNPIAPLSWNEILEQYAGIDGEAWPRECIPENSDAPEGLVSLAHLPLVVSWMKKVRETPRIDLLFSEEDRIGSRVSNTLTGFEFVGYDVGLGITEYTSYSYSAIYHEVLFGTDTALCNYRLKLNSHCSVSRQMRFLGRLL